MRFNGRNQNTPIDPFELLPDDDEIMDEEGGTISDVPSDEIPKLLRKDLREAASLLGIQEVKYLVSMYYQFQEQRKASANRVRTLGSTGAPLNFMTWMQDQMRDTEDTVKKVLDFYTAVEPTGMGKWARAVHGIGPVITAGLLAHIDVTKAPTAGHVWSFAGLDPNVVWEKGQRRPWNADLKVLCWKIGESFVKSGGSDKSYYGKLFKERKQYEWTRNLAGGNAPAAINILNSKNFGDDTIAKGWYLGKYYSPEGGKYTGAKEFPFVFDGELAKAPRLVEEINEERKSKGLPPVVGTRMLPPAHIHARAQRWTVKLFLAHFWEESYRRHFSVEPPLPYPIAFLNHVHRIAPPPDVPSMDVGAPVKPMHRLNTNIASSSEAERSGVATLPLTAKPDEPTPFKTVPGSEKTRVHKKTTQPRPTQAE